MLGRECSTWICSIAESCDTLVGQVRSLMGNGTRQTKGMYASPGETRSNEEFF